MEVVSVFGVGGSDLDGTGLVVPCCWTGGRGLFGGAGTFFLTFLSFTFEDSLDDSEGDLIEEEVSFFGGRGGDDCCWCLSKGAFGLSFEDSFDCKVVEAVDKLSFCGGRGRGCWGFSNGAVGKEAVCVELECLLFDFMVLYFCGVETSLSLNIEWSWEGFGGGLGLNVCDLNFLSLDDLAVDIDVDSLEVRRVTGSGSGRTGVGFGGKFGGTAEDVWFCDVVVSIEVVFVELFTGGTGSFFMYTMLIGTSCGSSKFSAVEDVSLNMDCVFYLSFEYKNKWNKEHTPFGGKGGLSLVFGGNSGGSISSNGLHKCTRKE
jgi:hypothetical protein